MINLLFIIYNDIHHNLSILIICVYFQRDEMVNTSVPTKILPIDQIITQMTNVALNNEQGSLSMDSQLLNSEFDDASRRSSISVQNLDASTPTSTNENLENNQSVMSASSVETVIDASIYKKDGNEANTPILSPVSNNNKVVEGEYEKNV